jgi:tetratricopeptide (TPR) repeat protein
MSAPETRCRAFFLTAAIAISLAASFSCAFTPAQKRDKALRSAQKAMDAHDFGRAIFFYKTASKNTPKDGEPHYRLALAYMELGDVRNAVAELKITTELDPKNKVAQIRLSELYALSRNRDLILDAERRTRSLLTSSPGDADALHTLAMAEFRLGKRDDALAHLEEAVKASPGFVKSSVALALLSIRSGDLPGAEKVMRRAAESAPKSVETAVAVGRFFLAFRRTHDAELEFRRAVDLNPKDPAALAALGETLLMQDKKGEADGMFARAAAAGDPKFSTIHAVYLMQDGRYDAAIQEFQKLAKAAPEDRQIRTRLIGALLAGNRIVEARQFLTKVLEKNPKDLEALLQRGELFLRDRKFLEAQADLSHVIREQPDSPEAHYLLARLNEATGSLESEKLELLESLKANPAFLPAREGLVQFYLASGDAKSALDSLDRSPDGLKSSTRFQVSRNWVLLAMNDFVEMQKSLDAAIAISPHPDLLYQKGILQARQSHWGAARAIFEEVLRLQPENARALDALARTYTGPNERDLGVQRIRDYANRMPRDPRLQHLLGEWLASSGNQVDARAAFLRAKAADPTYDAADWSLARLDLLQGKFDEARKLLEPNPNKPGTSSIESRLLLASLEDISGNTSASIQHYRKLAQLEPTNILVLNNLAYLLADKANQVEEARGFAESAARLAPDPAPIQDTLGWIYYRKGMYREAVLHLEKAVKTEGTPLRKYHLAMAYFKAGRADDARAVLKQAMAVNPNLPEAIMALQVQTESGR